MNRALLAFVVVGLLVAGTSARRRRRSKGKEVAPAGACPDGCDDGFVCSPVKSDACTKNALVTDASCWECSEKSQKLSKKEAKAEAKAAKRAEKAARKEEKKASDEEKKASQNEQKASKKAAKEENKANKGNKGKGKPIAPVGACSGGCPSGSKCRPDDFADCSRELLDTDPSCWACEAEDSQEEQSTSAQSTDAPEPDTAATADEKEAEKKAEKQAEKEAKKQAKNQGKGRNGKN
jgi:hypothetical protein